VPTCPSDSASPNQGFISFSGDYVSVTATYREISEKDIQKCIELWTNRMAEGYQDRLLLINAAKETNGYSGYVGEAKGEFIGFSAGYIGAFANVIDIPYAEVELNCELEPAQKVGYIAIVCVVEDHEDQGIGTNLCSKTATDFEHENIPLTAQVWHREGVDGGDIVTKIGFDPVVSISDYWRHTTAVYEPCPECGMSPCECRGTLFLKTNKPGNKSENTYDR
jgi:hypothetical protein